ncbi:hypothetical protein M2352_001360 [Azospirillum fermentarium]|uniref:VWA domain-containing protein n=1 Tax=Azospirillum fermentarium TaxID=1233114 RepID=UPI00222734B8|nr:VWA domain-containing protein [Azospirillum fermentarium]MCW2245769.1 hypothetical protein [Azospirillum fermentarium]
MSGSDDGSLPTRSSARPPAAAEVDAFLRAVDACPPPAVRAGGARGRLMFALDATISRQATWDRASTIQGEMFEAAAALGGLDVQLVYYRGYNECRASRWVGDARELLRLMTAVRCEAGRTQIGRVLAHALSQTRKASVNAVVFVGDCMEENLDELAAQAGELGILGVPLFLFHEAGDRAARAAFDTLARLSGGACCPFDAGSAEQLRSLLGAVAAYAAGGVAALEDYGRRPGGQAAVRLLTAQMAGARR